MKGYSMEKGEIVRGTQRGKDEAFHPIIFIKDHDASQFIGVMITHSAKFGNIELTDSHFENNPSKDGKRNYFVGCYLLKRNDWGPFKSIGQLSEDGVTFVTSQLKETKPRMWKA